MAKKFTTQRSTYIDPADGLEKRTPKISGKLITINSGNPEALYNLGTFCLQDKQYSKGLEILLKSLKLVDSKETRLNLATCYKFSGNTARAIKILEDLTVDFPDFPLPYNNLGLLKYDVREIEKAISLYQKALALRGDYADAKWNYALALNLKYFTALERGLDASFNDYVAAMSFFEARFEKTNPVTIARHDHGKKWEGQPLADGESIIILCEQGVGDMIQFLRYAYCFKQSQVTLHLPLDLHFLVKKGWNVTNNTEADKSTYWTPLMSVSKYFPISDEIYIDNESGAADALVPKVLLEDKTFKIGIVWKGNPDHANDAARSRVLKDFLWLREHGTLYSLQKGTKVSGYVKQLNLSHWAHTVGAIKGLDIVVTVDTSVAHLCGAMGIPVIVLIPCVGIDWRWGELGENCVWYKSMRFARMQSMDEVLRLLTEFKENREQWGPRKYVTVDPVVKNRINEQELSLA